MSRLALAGLVAGSVCSISSAAYAADVVSPHDGEMVGSRPQFVFDFADGSADVELSRSPDVKTAGDYVGAFVEQAASDYILIGPEWDMSAGVGQRWEGSRLNRGFYYWHAQVDPSGDSDFTTTWTPVRTLTVRDEPAIVEGYTAHARRLRPRRWCRTRVRVRGSIAFDDNESNPKVRYSVRYTARGRTVGRVRGEMSYDTTYGGILCTRARRLRVTIALRDKGGHLSAGERKRIRVRRA